MFDNAKIVLPLLTRCPQTWKEWRGLSSFEGPPEFPQSSAQQPRDANKRK